MLCSFCECLGLSYIFSFVLLSLFLMNEILQGFNVMKLAMVYLTASVIVNCMGIKPISTFSTVKRPLSLGEI